MTPLLTSNLYVQDIFFINGVLLKAGTALRVKLYTSFSLRGGLPLQPISATECN